MFTNLQIGIIAALNDLINNEEGFERYELNTDKDPNFFRRATIKMPKPEDYGNGCALITRKIDDKWYVGILDIWIDEDSGRENYKVIEYYLVRDDELKYKTPLMIKLLRKIDKEIGDDTIYNNYQIEE